MQQNTGTTNSVPKVATALIDGDDISVNLVAQSPDGKRISVAATFNHMGHQVDAVTGNIIAGGISLDLGLLSGTATPEFPLKKYNDLIESGQVEAAEDLKMAHELAVEEWQNQGNRSLPDAIGDAVLAWADAAHNVKQTDHDGPVIKPQDVVVKNVIRANETSPGTFVVTLTPSWG
jgi:hypothetical protein